MDEIKKILTENKESLYPSHWTCSNHIVDGVIKKQLILKYSISESAEKDLDDRINLFRLKQPEYIKDFYLVKNYKEAQEISDKILQEAIQEEVETKQQQESEGAS